MSLSLSNVVRVTVLSGLKGLSEVNTSMLGLITDEAPIPNDFGVYKAYKDATEVAQDFGSSAETTKLAETVFSQNPNILTGNGSLLIVPRLQSAAATNAVVVGGTVDFSSLSSTDYAMNLNIDGAGAANVSVGEIDTTSLATITASLNANLTGAEFSLSGEVSAAKVTLSSTGTPGSISTLVLADLSGPTPGTNLLRLMGFLEPDNSTYKGGIGTGTDGQTGLESIRDCILRTHKSVPYFGIIYNTEVPLGNIGGIASLIQSLDIMQFIPTAAIDSVDTTANNFASQISKGFNKTRFLYYSGDGTAAGETGAWEAIKFAAGYASRGLSVNFSGTNTMHTMHLKEVVGVEPDPVFATTSGQTYYNRCQAAGTDFYGDFGVPGVVSVGLNDYFDEVYIRLALKLKITVSVFNTLKQTNTKIPQTEAGLDILKGSCRNVLKQFVTNGSFAPGAWKGSTFFGNPDDQIRNIEEFGYWIYSLPIGDQTTADREARIAPLIQIAAKSAGAFHSSDVTVLIER